ncbi:MAG: CrcB family protein [Puniceicoccaceae bacterium]
MSVLVVLAVGLGGAAGALLRALAGRLLKYDFPVATLVVNVSGSFFLPAIWYGLPAEAELIRVFLGAGFCGALTTFSTFILESVLLARAGHLGKAALYLALTLSLCSLASWGGFYLMT